MSTLIHPTAVVAPTAQLGVDVEIGPYTMVGPFVSIGDRTRIGPQVVVQGVTRIGEENFIVGQAALGNAPQDLSYRGEATQLIIGDRNTVREFVTINRGTIKGGGVTSMGNDNLLMACSHVAHDCELENKIILGNGVLLAGHCRVESCANLSGMAGAVAFTTIGAFAYIGAMTRIARDVPPYMIVEGHEARVRGVNVVGLQRNGVPADDIDLLRATFKRIWRSGKPRRPILDELNTEEHTSPYLQELLASLGRTELGLKGRYRESRREEFNQLGIDRILEGVERP